ncbi:MAG: NADH-quinone oxidoreductase subunit N, partial [Ignavibacteriae bacterium]|nr:NADH-quinone oxidoreductase subunit N [Ignavibacteriota bacterium]
MIPLKDLLNVLPLIIIGTGAIVTLMMSAFLKKGSFFVMLTSAVFVLGAFVISFFSLNKDVIVFNEMLRINPVSLAFSMIILFTVLITIIASPDYLGKLEINFGEYYSLLLFALTGMLMMVFANDLLIIFIGLETMSVCFYVMAGMIRKRIKSNESAMKYFLLGAFMTGFLLYGMSLIYGITGTTNIQKIVLAVQIFKNPVFLVGISLFLIGFMFKIGIFPFQMWIPDVYDGSPTIVAGMMSTAGKIAAVGTLSPFLISLYLVDYKILFSVAATLTMLYGNIIAISQTNVKRLLAYSSIASAGYIVVGLTAMTDFAQKGIAFYLMAFSFMQLGAFIIVSIIEQSSPDGKDFRNISIDDYKGLGKRNPVLATVFTVFLFSLGGIPPFAGFWGKYYLFFAAIEAKLIWLSIVAILLSLVAIYYYLKIIVYMWFRDADEAGIYEPVKVTTLGVFALFVAIAGTFVFGVY